MKKLSENFGCWSDKLHDDDVYDCFVTIFAGVKKGGGVGVAADSRAAARQLLEELEGKVEEARQKVSRFSGFSWFSIQMIDRLLSTTKLRRMPKLPRKGGRKEVRTYQSWQH